MTNPIDALFKKEVIQPEVLQRSELEKIALCPHGAKLCKEHKITGGGNILCEAGTLAHALVKEAFDFCREQGDLSEVANYFQNELPKVRPDLQPDIIKGARALAERLTRLPLNKLIGVEYQIDYPPREKDGSVKNPPAWLISMEGKPLVLTTALDFVAHGNARNIIVVDYKTGYKKRSNEEAYNDFQAQFGAWLLFQLFPECESVDWFFDESRWGSTAYAEFVRDKQDKYLPNTTVQDLITSRIAEVVRLWATGCDDAWPVKEKCLWCDAIKHCKFANPEALEIGADPAAFIDKLQVISALADKMQDDATVYLKAHGPIEGTSCVFDRKPPSDRFYTEIRPKEPIVKEPRTRKGKK